MNDKTVAQIKMLAAFSGSPVDVAICTECAQETVVSPAVAAANGLPGRCPGCGCGVLRFERCRMNRGAIEVLRK